MKLSTLHENFIQRHSFTAFDDNRPVIRAREPNTPLVVAERWVQLDDGRHQKKFTFRTHDQRNKFVVEMLFNETANGRRAKLVVEERVVHVVLGDEVMKVTNADREMAKFADELYRDVTYNNMHERT